MLFQTTQSVASYNGSPPPADTPVERVLCISSCPLSMYDTGTLRPGLPLFTDFPVLDIPLTFDALKSVQKYKA